MNRDVTNADRAEWAHRAVMVFAQYTGTLGNEDNETILGDLLTDLRHWCDEQGLDFDAAVAGSQTTYEEELRDDA